MYGKLKNIDDLLGGVVRNESGHIIAAKVVQNFWFLSLNFSAVDMDKTGNYAGTADWVSAAHVKSADFISVIYQIMFKCRFYYLFQKKFYILSVN